MVFELKCNGVEKNGTSIRNRNLDFQSSSKSKCHLRVVIFRRVPSARKKSHSIARKWASRGSEQKNDTCLTLCITVHGWSLHKGVIFVRVRSEVLTGLTGTHEIACVVRGLLGTDPPPPRTPPSNLDLASKIRKSILNRCRIDP